MRQINVSRDNYEFFVVVVGWEMLSYEFAMAVLKSFNETVQYGVEKGDYTGYIVIDSSNLRDDSKDIGFSEVARKVFAEDIKGGLVRRIAHALPEKISGKLDDEVEVISGIYKFSFKISGYEWDGAHNFKPVKKLAYVPEGERMGRVVSLKITHI